MLVLPPKMHSLIFKCTLLFIALLSGCTCTEVLRHFEYKHSFKPPYLSQQDGSIPFWVYGGNAIANSENVRVAPSLKSQKGAVWSKYPTNFDWWEVDMVFRISGRGRVGADGLAFWYTANVGDYKGEVFGSSDKWVGLGVFFDSFDNDNNHNNPFIMAVTNDGTQSFDHANDGKDQMIGGCLRDFRNKPFSTRVKIEYYKNVLTVLFHNGNTNNENDFEVCIRVTNVFLPKVGFFGISAATGGLADDHDVKQFITHSLYPADASGGLPPVQSEDQKKIAAEFAEYQRKHELQKEQYQKEHPDAQKENDDEEGWFESDGQRELRQIFSVQAQMYDAIRLLNSKLDEIVGRQERALNMLSTVQSSINAVGSPGAVHATGSAQAGSIPKHDVDSLLSTQKDTFNAAMEIRNFVITVHQKVESIIQKQSQQPTAQVQSIGYDTAAVFNEVRDLFNSVKRDMASTAQKINASAQLSCPTVSCLSISMFLLFSAVQVFVIIGYLIYRDNKDASAKKFY